MVVVGADNAGDINVLDVGFQLCRKAQIPVGLSLIHISLFSALVLGENIFTARNLAALVLVSGGIAVANSASCLLYTSGSAHICGGAARVHTRGFVRTGASHPVLRGVSADFP